MSQKKTSRYDKLVAGWPALRHVLHTCAGCGAVGLRPGMLATRAGDYGLRERAGALFAELPLNERGFCPDCADQFSDRAV